MAFESPHKVRPELAFIPVTLITPRGELVRLSRLGGPAFSVHIRASHPRILANLLVPLMFIAAGFSGVVWGGLHLPHAHSYTLATGGEALVGPLVIISAGLLFGGVGLWVGRTIISIAGRRLRMRFNGQQIDLRLKKRFSIRHDVVTPADFEGVQYSAHWVAGEPHPQLHVIELIHTNDDYTLPLYVGRHKKWVSNLPEAYANTLGVTLLPRRKVVSSKAEKDD